ncbi:hypothetical protein [Polaromonas sp. JS666]|uniref:hypothetical protein n=1 Tax=Polaromonas sp. (strain JS666 / ATCC BAA-500) TaxID=296591 RepID=UPI0000537150|nr:hypothetical protein [Polaromonas sp. JS666]ABE42910.1 hypothetical protein Bpro_0954 [Polaromonas sp. JS666]
MSQLAQKLASYENRFKNHQKQVDQFFETAKVAFNTEYFPSIKVTRAEDDKGQLSALGMRYELDFRFVVLADGPTTLLEVSLPATAHTGKERLALWYVDSLGNVRTDPNNSFSTANVDEKSFLIELVDKAQQAYFALVKKTLPTIQ